MRLCRPFFSYYGGKWRVAKKHYPPPKHKTIIEPFAGSAGYAVRHYQHDVILYDADPVITGVWEFLISATPKEILDIPDVPPGGSVDDLDIHQEARWLVGFWLNRGVSRPCKVPSKWMKEGTHPGSFWGAAVRNRIAQQVQGIKHWRIHHKPYTDAPDTEACWFIDPPYQKAGRHYRVGSNRIDYSELAQWCASRRGQAIVCENEGADWLPFAPLADFRTSRKGSRSQEVIWVGGARQATFRWGS